MSLVIISKSIYYVNLGYTRRLHSCACTINEWRGGEGWGGVGGGGGGEGMGWDGVALEVASLICQHMQKWMQLDGIAQ